MQIIKIEGTATTPAIKFDPKQGKLEIKGISVPERTVEFYRPLLDNLERYTANPITPTWVDIHLNYFNTTSSKCLLDMFRHLKTIHAQGIQVIINWYYEENDEDMKEAGEDYQTILNMTFNMLHTENKGPLSS